MERRNFPRLEASLPVLYFTDGYLSPNVAWTLDLSLGGARIESSNGLTTGDRFWMHIAIDRQTIKCRGKAIYVLVLESEGMTAGVKFEALSEHDKLHLRQYLAYVTEQRV